MCAWHVCLKKTLSLGKKTHIFSKNNGIFEKKQAFFWRQPCFFQKTTWFWSNCKVLRCKFGVSLHQTYTSWGVSSHQTYIKLTLVKCKFDANLHPWSVSLLQTYTGKCKFTLVNVSLMWTYACSKLTLQGRKFTSNLHFTSLSLM